MTATLSYNSQRNPLQEILVGFDDCSEVEQEKLTWFKKFFGKSNSVSVSSYIDEDEIAGIENIGELVVKKSSKPLAIEVPKKKGKKSIRWFDEVYINADPLRGPVSSRMTYDPNN